MTPRLAAVAKLAHALGQTDLSSVRQETGRMVWDVEVLVSNDNKDTLTSFLKVFKVENLCLNQTWINDYSSISLQQGDIISFSASLPEKEGFFQDLQHAKAYYIGATTKPSDLFYLSPPTLISESSRSTEWDSFRGNYERCVEALESLALLAHYKGTDEAIFIDPSETSSASLAISLNIVSISKKDFSILDSPINSDFLLSLTSDVRNRSPNYIKELNIFRSSLFEFNRHSKQETKNSVDIAADFLSGLSKLEDIFCRNLQAYMSGMTLEKIKTEVASEQLKFTEQATKGLLDISTKMLAVPAALGLANIYQSDISPYVLLITCIFVFLPLITQWANLSIINISQSLAFRDLDGKLKDLGVQQHSEDLIKARRKLRGSVIGVKIMLFIYMAIVGVIMWWAVPDTDTLSKLLSTVIERTTQSFLNLLAPKPVIIG